jgi:hypothetical protein
MENKQLRKSGTLKNLLLEIQKKSLVQTHHKIVRGRGVIAKVL